MKRKAMKSFSPTVTAQIVQALETVAGEAVVLQMLSRIEGIASSASRWISDNEHGPTPSDSRQALLDISEALEKIEQASQQLGFSGVMAVGKTYNKLASGRSPGDDIAAPYLADLMHKGRVFARLRGFVDEAAEAVEGRGPGRGGDNLARAKAWTLPWLAEAYLVEFCGVFQQKPTSTRDTACERGFRLIVEAVLGFKGTHVDAYLRTAMKSEAVLAALASLPKTLK